MDAPLLRRKVVQKVDGERVLMPDLHGIDLMPEAAESVALTGPASSGGSRRLKLIGLLDRPAAGEVYRQGEAPPTSGESERDISPEDRAAARAVPG